MNKMMMVISVMIVMNYIFWYYLLEVVWGVWVFGGIFLIEKNCEGLIE